MYNRFAIARNKQTDLSRDFPQFFTYDPKIPRIFYNPEVSDECYFSEKRPFDVRRHGFN